MRKNPRDRPSAFHSTRRDMSNGANDAGAAAFVGNPLSLSLANQEFNAWVKTRNAGASSRARGTTTATTTTNGGSSTNGRRREESTTTSATTTTHRFKTPYMTTDDLQKPPKPWREFLRADQVFASYSIPKTVFECKVRLDGNVFEYIGNYVRMGVVFGCVAVYKNPTAVVGAVASAKLYQWMERNLAPTGELHAVRLLGTMVSWFVMMYTKASAAMSMTMLLTMAFLLAHGCCRRLDAPKPIKIGKHSGISKWESQSPRKRGAGS